MSRLPWKRWNEVVQLREDLRSGDLPLHMFAADLYEVMMQRGKRPIYEKPREFFALTFPTYNLRQLGAGCGAAAGRKNDKAVRQLELTYGGGKTHTLITLRHLVHDPEKLPDLPAVAEFVAGDRPEAAQMPGRGPVLRQAGREKGMEVRSPGRQDPEAQASMERSGLSDCRR